ncbi:MAG: 2-oxoglutarate dehydrogenase E1 component [Alphaproteobacteria bacterium]|nr:2-oxoglutarate dehydrogenase E1 component [Alphaproteobacteria bacterium]NCQ67188.1 2-oxoglutarate dehydrogenase E1 component [Alphaproteobacteria bacterium]
MPREIELSSFLSGSNALFLEQTYSSYVKDPASVDPSWVQFFASLGDDVHAVLQEAVGASWSHRVGEQSLAYGRYGETDSDESSRPNATKPSAAPAKADTQQEPQGQGATVTAINQTTLDALRASMLIRVYRVRAHLNANLDPLGIHHKDLHPELDPKSYGFNDKDYDRPIYLGGSLGLEKATLREILAILKRTYCGSIGVEFMHIQDPDQKSWIQMQMENYQNGTTKEERIHALDYLNRADDFERFLAVKYPGAKRFGLEGGESFIPAMEVILEDSARRGVCEVILGMAHRGRLNVLANIMEKPYKSIFSEFHGNEPTPEEAQQVQGSGDVKYHLGVSTDRVIAGHKIHLSLTANPSHLEGVNPVVIGKVRAKQTRLKDDARTKVLGILIHGDAAFAGQGLVAETLEMSELRGYKVGGTIHVIINNQIGFTTSPHLSRSSPYCSDVVKGIQAPVLHVNGDDVDAVARVARMASEFRYKFKKDVVIDLYCYRRHGHNEIDEPSFTQPVMYRKIRAHETTRNIYNKLLIDEKVISEEASKELTDAFHQKLQTAFEESKEYTGKRNDWLEGVWSGMRHSVDLHKPVMTGAEHELLEKVAKALTSYPKTFDIHKRLAKQLEAKDLTLKSEENIDWATGEALAFGSLLLEGYPVRLSGQDVGRGTFSQRHAIMYDQKNGAPYIPLNNIGRGQREIEVVDSPLSEVAVLGFEHGYSLADPNILVLWEAQFGDFANGAQMVIDQFIAAGEAKWSRMSALVMLLPHGYEGQGPEHSSARLERYLQLCAEENMFVANCTTPASFFHILRRQMHSETRKPLVIMTPKSLLRHKKAVSKLSDFEGKTHFRAVLPEADTTIKEKEVTRVILCSGKVYYDLLETREANDLKSVAILRLEQLYPFPHQLIVTELRKYAEKADVVWCQEESENMGAWTFIDRRLEAAMGEAKLKKANRPLYVGRPPSASTATGFAKTHLREQEILVKEALGLK